MRRLPDAELEIMLAVWACPPPVLRTDVENILSRKRALAPSTLLTLLSRLVERGFLTVEKRGPNNCYTPVISKHDYLASRSRSFLERLCGGDVRVFAAALCDSGLTEEEIQELREILEMKT